MKNRLIELLNEATFGVNENTLADYLKKETIDRVADYLIANGVIVPHCKVGDKIYALSASRTKIYVLTITHFLVNENETQIWAVGTPYSSEPAYICNNDDLYNNEWVFLTREEAEKALAERRGT